MAGQAFLKKVEEEYRKVRFPKREAMLKKTAFVIVSAMVVGTMVALLDFGSQAAVSAIVGLIA